SSALAPTKNRLSRKSLERVMLGHLSASASSLAKLKSLEHVKLRLRPPTLSLDGDSQYKPSVPFAQPRFRRLRLRRLRIRIVGSAERLIIFRIASERLGEHTHGTGKVGITMLRDDADGGAAAEPRIAHVGDAEIDNAHGTERQVFFEIATQVF